MIFTQYSQTLSVRTYAVSFLDNPNLVQAHRDCGLSRSLLLAAVELDVDEVEEEVDVDPGLAEHVHHSHPLVLQLQQLLNAQHNYTYRVTIQVVTNPR